MLRDLTHINCLDQFDAISRLLNNSSNHLKIAGVTAPTDHGKTRLLSELWTKYADVNRVLIDLAGPETTPLEIVNRISEKLGIRRSKEPIGPATSVNINDSTFIKSNLRIVALNEPPTLAIQLRKLVDGLAGRADIGLVLLDHIDESSDDVSEFVLCDLLDALSRIEQLVVVIAHPRPIELRGEPRLCYHEIPPLKRFERAEVIEAFRIAGISIAPNERDHIAQMFCDASEGVPGKLVEMIVNCRDAQMQHGDT